MWSATWKTKIASLALRIADSEYRDMHMGEMLTVGWAIPSLTTIIDISKSVSTSGGTVISVGAGLGAVEHLLSQTPLVRSLEATDEAEQVNSYCEIKQIEASSAVAQSKANCLLMIWPPLDSPMAYEALMTFSQRANSLSRVIYWGEPAGGCTADDKFHAALETHCTMVTVIDCHRRYGIKDWAFVYRFNEPAGSSSGARRDPQDCSIAGVDSSSGSRSDSYPDSGPGSSSSPRVSVSAGSGLTTETSVTTLNTDVRSQAHAMAALQDLSKSLTAVTPPIRDHNASRAKTRGASTTINKHSNPRRGSSAPKTLVQRRTPRLAGQKPISKAAADASVDKRTRGVRTSSGTVLANTRTKLANQPANHV